MSRPENAPSDSDFYDEAWSDARTAPPAWFREPLHITRPESNGRGWPVRRVWCDDHPDFHHTLDHAAVIDAAEEHVRTKHAGQPPRPPLEDPWDIGTEPHEDVPF